MSDRVTEREKETRENDRISECVCCESQKLVSRSIANIALAVIRIHIRFFVGV